MTWYFISYDWKRKTSSSTWNRDVKITQRHPVDWLREMETKYGEEQLGGKTVYTDYYIVFWSEIPEAVAKEYLRECG